jgi:hypothetical protein
MIRSLFPPPGGECVVFLHRNTHYDIRGTHRTITKQQKAEALRKCLGSCCMYPSDSKAETSLASVSYYALTSSILLAARHNVPMQWSILIARRNTLGSRALFLQLAVTKPPLIVQYISDLPKFARFIPYYQTVNKKPAAVLAFDPLYEGLSLFWPNVLKRYKRHRQ